MKFLQSHYNDKKVSIVLSQIVAVIENDEGKTLVCATDGEGYTLTEPYDQIMNKIEKERYK